MSRPVRVHVLPAWERNGLRRRCPNFPHTPSVTVPMDTSYWLSIVAEYRTLEDSAARQSLRACLWFMAAGMAGRG